MREPLGASDGSCFRSAGIVAILVCASLSVACRKKPPADGAALFASTCARCHGSAGKGGAPLVDGGPNVRDLSDPEFHRRPDDAIARSIKEGTANGMPAFGSTYDDEQVRALVAHVRSLKRN